MFGRPPSRRSRWRSPAARICRPQARALWRFSTPAARIRRRALTRSSTSTPRPSKCSGSAEDELRATIRRSPRLHRTRDRRRRRHRGDDLGGERRRPVLLAAALEKLSAGANSATIPEQVVGRDGSITVPYAGRVRVAGRTTRDVQEIIQHALEGKAIQPQVLVNDLKPISNTVTIGGEGIGMAQRMPLSVKGDRLLDVIAQAGGVKMQVNEIFVLLQRGGATERVPLARVTEDSRENIFMRPGDVVTLVRDPQTFLVSAPATSTPKSVRQRSAHSGAGAGQVGGVADYRADARGLFVFRYEQPAVVHALRPDSPLGSGGGRVPVVYHVDLKDPNSLFMEQRFQIANRDLIYISNAPWSIRKAIAIFNGLLSPVSSTASTAASAAITIK